MATLLIHPNKMETGFNLEGYGCRELRRTSLKPCQIQPSRTLDATRGLPDLSQVDRVILFTGLDDKENQALRDFAQLAQVAGKSVTELTLPMDAFLSTPLHTFIRSHYFDRVQESFKTHANWSLGTHCKQAKQDLSKWLFSHIRMPFLEESAEFNFRYVLNYAQYSLEDDPPIKRMVAEWTTAAHARIRWFDMREPTLTKEGCLTDRCTKPIKDFIKNALTAQSSEQFTAAQNQLAQLEQQLKQEGMHSVATELSRCVLHEFMYHLSRHRTEHPLYYLKMMEYIMTSTAANRGLFLSQGTNGEEKKPNKHTLSLLVPYMLHKITQQPELVLNLLVAQSRQKDFYFNAPDQDARSYRETIEWALSKVNLQEHAAAFEYGQPSELGYRRNYLYGALLFAPKTSSLSTDWARWMTSPALRQPLPLQYLPEYAYALGAADDHLNTNATRIQNTLVAALEGLSEAEQKTQAAQWKKSLMLTMFERDAVQLNLIHNLIDESLAKSLWRSSVPVLEAANSVSTQPKTSRI